jgi:hypothetical protein
MRDKDAEDYGSFSYVEDDGANFSLRRLYVGICDGIWVFALTLGEIGCDMADRSGKLQGVFTPPA